MLTIAKIELRDLRPIAGPDGEPLTGSALKQALRDQVMREHAGPHLSAYAGFEGDALWLLSAPAGKTPMEVLAPDLLAGKTAECLPYLEVLVKVAPDLHAWYSLGMAYWMLDRKAESIEPLRRAFGLAPDSAQLRFVLGRALSTSDRFAEQKEGDHLLQGLKRGPDTDAFFEEVVGLRNAHAQRQLSATGFRPDAMAYMASAMKTFSTLSPRQIQELVLEIGLLGQKGFDLDGTATLHRLKGLPGEFTGMHCISLMYAGLKHLNMDVGLPLDLSAEYAAAKDFYGMSRKA